MTNDDCESCDLVFLCVIRTSKYMRECPCLICLVKMVCEEECDRRKALLNKIWKRGKSGSVLSGA